MNTQAAFEELCNIAKDNACLQTTMALLEWDQQTKLPEQGNTWRARQLTLLAGDLHRRETDERIGELLQGLEEAASQQDPASDFAATVRGIQRDYRKKTKVPAKLVQAITNACSTGQQIWVEARKNNDFQTFAPKLKEIFDLKREYADVVGETECRYDALLDDYEPEASTQLVNDVLSGLKNELVPLLQQISESTDRPDSSILHREFPVAAQESIGRAVSSEIGFDYRRGRLDVTHHPFCETMGPDDVRLTTRYDKTFFSPAFFGTLHEAGHGIYEQGLRRDQFGLPPGRFCSLGIHESQSRLWENLVGRSEAFWRYFYPRAQAAFPNALSNVDQDEFWKAINSVQPSLIRVEADEATYNLHIIIRFELEQAVIDEVLPITELPEAWDQKYEEYLGVRPGTPAEGVLQDIHWSAGLMGYFPTYSLGNLYASQLFEAAERDLGSLDTMFAEGNFGDLTAWLNSNVHQQGNCMSAPALVESITGVPLSHDALMRHLNRKLSKIYRL